MKRPVRRKPGPTPRYGPHSEFIASFAGLDERVLDYVFENCLVPMPGLETLVDVLHANDMRMVISSATFTHFTRRLQHLFGMHGQRGTELEIIDGRLTGERLTEHVIAETKSDWLAELHQELPPGARILAIGNGGNDRLMLKAAHASGGLGIAIRGDQAARQAATHIIDFCGLDAILNLFMDSDDPRFLHQLQRVLHGQKIDRPHEIERAGRATFAVEPRTATTPVQRRGRSTLKDLETRLAPKKSPRFYTTPRAQRFAVVQGRHIPDEWLNMLARRARMKGSIARLVPGVLHRDAFRLDDVHDHPALRAWLEATSRRMKIDYAVVPGYSIDQVGLMVSDVDKTLIQADFMDEMAIQRNIVDQLARTRLRKSLSETTRDDFIDSMRLGTRLFAGMSKAELDAIYATIPFTPGIAGLFDAFRPHNTVLGLASSGFSYFTQRIRKDFGLHHDLANTLEMTDDDLLTGDLLDEIFVDGLRKAEWIIELYDRSRLMANSIVVAIGDGENDIHMFNAAHQKGGLGISFRGKPKTEAAAAAVFRYSGLDAIRNLFWNPNA